MGKKTSLNDSLSNLNSINLSNDNNPVLVEKVIETHCHLDMLKEQDLSHIVNQSNKIGIEKIITISISPENFKKTINISNQYDNIFCTQGVHPHKADLWSKDLIDQIKNNSQLEKVVAIGEIGLDYHYNFSPRKVQIKAFEEQLELAAELDLPVVIHSREADDDMISIIQNFAIKLKKKGVLHSFTSGKNLAEEAIKNDFYLGFNGIITFKNATNVRDVLKDTPLENILIETDAPYLTPTPFRGRENAPFYLPFIAESICKIKNIDFRTCLKQIYKNSHQVFSKI